MVDSKSVPISEIKEVFEFLEEANHLFHQPLYIEDKEMVKKFATENYPQIKRLYYEVVWNWLPDEEKEKYENR